MALLNFHYGLVKDLPATKTDGNLYITTDTQGLYVDLDGSRIHVSDFIQVADVNALNALGSYNTSVFYYVESSNALMKYVGSSVKEDTGETVHNWKQLNSTADLRADLNDVITRVTQAETDISALESADEAIEDRIDNLNALDIETTSEITVTTAVGNYAKGDKIAKDTNLQAILLNMLCKDAEPSVTNPRISKMQITGDTVNNQAVDPIYKEVGTTYSPAYEFKTTLGSYTANGVSQATGVSWSNYSAKEKSRPDGATAEEKTTNKGTFASFVVTDDTDYYIAGTATYSDGNIPTTYLGTPRESEKIVSATAGPVNSVHVKGYRPIFCGMTANTNALDSTTIRGMQNKGNPVGQTITFTASELTGVKRFIVAIPASSTLTVKSAIITSSQNADATKDYVKQTTTLEVAGAEGYTTTKPYNIWIYQPASIADVEVHSVTIG